MVVALQELGEVAPWPQEVARGMQGGGGAEDGGGSMLLPSKWPALSAMAIAGEKGPRAVLPVAS